MGFAMFFLSEYCEMLAVAALGTTLFFGGWRGPFLPGVFWFFIKVFLFQFLFIWLRGTLPRVRYDQVMALGWKVLLPLALINIFWASVLKMFILA
jgi:NADH-quinone oxidoreductase subunit H